MADLRDRLVVKLDEDLSASVADSLSAEEYDVRTVFGQGWSGMPDRELWPRLQGERAFLITADKGFGDLRTYAPGSHAGVLVLRADRESIVAYKQMLDSVTSRMSLRDLIGSTAVVTTGGLRIRRS